MVIDTHFDVCRNHECSDIVSNAPIRIPHRHRFYTGYARTGFKTIFDKSAWSMFCIVVSSVICLLFAEERFLDQPSSTQSTLQPYSGSNNASSIEQKARQHGLSEAQIEYYKKIYGENQKKGAPDEQLQRQQDNASDGTSVQEEQQSEETDEEENYIAHDFKTSKTGLPYFGYDIFSSIPDAFKPTSIGPVDPGYAIGPGDVLRLAVWGQAEFQYELTVSKEGKVLIPVVGQVYVTGIPFQELQEKIKNLLSKHYSGLKTHPPRTFMDLTVAKMKPVRIFIMGEVKKPGGYTISSYGTVFNALYSIGGPLHSGSLRDIRVVRNDKEIARIDIYDYLITGRCTTDVRLQNNDIIFVPPRKTTVAITGPVLRPARYELKENDMLQALLSYAGGIRPSTNIDRAQIYRTIPFEQRSSTKSVQRALDIELKDFIGSKKDIPLYDQDSIAIIPLLDDLQNIVFLSGAVQYPGEYQSDSLSLHELIFEYGKPIENKAFMKRADLIRLNEDKLTKKTIPLDLNRLKTEADYDRMVAPGDAIIVYDIEVEKPTDIRITVGGEVNKPGIYELNSDMSITDAILRAGGFTRKAYRKQVDIYRPDDSTEDSLTKIYKVPLSEPLNYMHIDSFTLRDRDRIIIRIDPAYTEGEFVQLHGSVRYPGMYAIKKHGEKLSDIIERAGGILPEAFLEGAKLKRGEKRVVIDFEKAYYKKSKKDDISLYNGDVIEIPLKPNTILIQGQVNNPGLFNYVENKRVRFYIDRAGGLGDSVKCILVTHPNGETNKIKGLFFNNQKVTDGSEILVVKKAPINKTGVNEGPTITEVVRDTLAIVTSAVTIIAILVQLREK